MGKPVGCQGPCSGSAQELTLEKVRVEEKGRKLGGGSQQPPKERQWESSTVTLDQAGVQPPNQKIRSAKPQGPRDSLTWRTSPLLSTFQQSDGLPTPTLCVQGRGHNRPMAWGQRELGRGRWETHKDTGQGGLASCLPGTWGARKAPQVHTLSKGYLMNDQLHTQHSRKKGIDW